jgi:ABC-type multidrug transport system fused ATPase/permease subunit
MVMMAAPSSLQLLKRFHADFLRPHRRALTLAMLALLLQAGLALPIPFVQGQLLDQLLESSSGPDDLMRSIGVAAVGITACLAVRGALGWQAASTMNRVGLEVVRELTVVMHHRLQSQPLAYFRGRTTGSMIMRLTNDVGTLMIFLQTGTLQLICDGILAAGIAAVLFIINWPIALAAVAGIPFVAAGHIILARPLHGRAQESRSRMVAFLSHLSERLAGLRVIQAFGQEGVELARIDGILQRQKAAGRRTLRLSTLHAALTLLFGGLGVVAVIAIGAAGVHSGAMTKGELLTCYGFAILLYAPGIRFAQFQSGMAATCVAAQRIVELLELPVAAPRAVTAAIGPIRGAVSVRNLEFRFRSDAAPVLRGVNIHLEPGQLLGVVGASGSGKSTLLRLIAGLYAAPAGSVLIDGVDVVHWPADCRRRQVVYVPQRSVLFQGTIRSNLTYAVGPCADHELWRMLEAVDLDRLIHARTGRLDAPLGPGGEGLSGGQKQRLALARALLLRPVVLLLDQCTHALDAETDALVHANLDQLLPRASRILAAHRPELLDRADFVIDLDRRYEPKSAGRRLPATVSDRCARRSPAVTT